MGEAKLDDPQLNDALAFLRQTAIELEPGGLTTKLIIPDSQILYFKMDAPKDTQDVSDTVKSALEGKTPYAVDDLAFDWLKDGQTLTVAAVARETLAEAEAFAQEHQFNPVSFVAMPAGNQFDGEPFFGTTGAIGTILDESTVVERDAFAIKVVPLPEAAALEASLSTPPKDDSAAIAEDGADVADKAAATAVETPEPADPDQQPDIPPDALNTDPGESTSPPKPAFSSRREEKGAAVKLSGPSSTPDLPAPRLSVGAVRAPGTPKADMAKADMAKGTHSGVTAAMAPDLPAPEVAAADSVTPDTQHKIKQESDRAGNGTVASPVPASPAPAEPLIAQRDANNTSNAPKAASPTALPAANASDTGAEDLTVFGARKTNRGGSHRYLGLIMTFVLILAMAAAAVWSTFFQGNMLSSLFGPGTEEPDPIHANLAPASSPDQPAGFAISQPDPEATPLPEGGEAIEIIATDGAIPPPVADPAPAPAEITLAEAEEIYAATNIWVRAPDHGTPPATQTLESLYIASPDPQVTSLDALALPLFDQQPGLSKPAEHFNPAPAGTEYVLDDRGFVVPSDEGTINPDGIRVFAGRPPSATPVRPRNAAVPGTAELDGAALAALAGYRPAARPGNLQEIHERGLYGGLTRAELAARRPAPRPASPQSAPDVDATPTEFAVARSAIPPRRPGNIDELVAAARTNTENQEVQIASAAAAGVSAALGRAPEIPTHASVARAATQPNAINLRRISLIGVYGSASDRRALIRLRNGRYVKVEVGDRVDGGRVAAIGDHSLQYVKGGRNVTLAMPET